MAFPFIIPGGNSSSNFDSLYELTAGGGVLAFVSVKQRQVGQSLEPVVHHEDILEVDILLLLISHF